MVKDILPKDVCLFADCVCSSVARVSRVFSMEFLVECREIVLTSKLASVVNQFVGAGGAKQLMLQYTLFF